MHLKNDKLLLAKDDLATPFCDIWNHGSTLNGNCAKILSQNSYFKHRQIVEWLSG